LFLEPADRPPLLLIASSETIEVLHLNGSKASARTPVKGSAILTLDYSYKEDTICWIESRDLSSQLKCTKISKAGQLTEERTISIAQYLHSEYLTGLWQNRGGCPGELWQEPAEVFWGLLLKIVLRH